MSDVLNAEGWLPRARRCPSPNFNARPPGCAPELLVVHNISLPPGCFGGADIEALFCNKLDCSADPFYAELEGLEVSAHFLIDRRGALSQFVSVNERAWHAGVSAWAGRENCNDYSIGVELEGTDTLPFADLQYVSLAALIIELQQVFPTLAHGAIVGHSDIAPGRKTDPGGAFDWARLRRLMSVQSDSALDSTLDSTLQG
jgi:AmpD protein